MADAAEAIAPEPEAASLVALDRSASHLLHRALQHALDIYSEEAGPGAVTQRQFAVLTAVAGEEGLNQTGLVRATGIDRSTLADMVSRMIGRGLLERERSAVDARANAVRLTAKGRQVLLEASPKVAAADERILALAPSGSRERFLAILKAMSDAAEGAPPAAVDNESEPAKKKKKKDKAARAAKDEKKRKKKPKR